VAWIESHQKLKDEPKLFELMAGMNWNKAETIGRLHLFWWWCVDHAEDGDLRRFNDTHLALAVELNPADGSQFVQSMLKAGFLERQPYFRIVNWWKFVSHFMKRRYKDNKDGWERIEKLYSSVTPVLHEIQNQPNQPTKQNRTVKAFTPPTVDEVRAYCLERKNRIDAQEFVDKNESIGWVDKHKRPYKDWKAVIRHWEKFQKVEQKSERSRATHEYEKTQAYLKSLGES